MRTVRRRTAACAAIAVVLSMLGVDGALAATGPTEMAGDGSRGAPAAPAPTAPDLVVTTTTAEPPPVGLAVPSGTRLHVGTATNSLLVVGVQTSGVIDRTEGAAPTLEISLPAGLRLVGTRTLADPGSAGEWTCVGSGTVACELRAGDGGAGWIGTDSRADLILTLRPRGDAAASEGSLGIAATASGRGMSGSVSPMADTTTVEVVADDSIPPDVRFRVASTRVAGAERIVDLEVLALSDLDDTGPAVRLSDLVPPGATAITVNAPGWTCTPTQCTRTSPLRPGRPATLRVTFTPTDPAGDLAWVIATRYPGGSLTRGVPIPGGLPVTIPKPTVDLSDLTLALDTAKGQTVTAGSRLPLILRTGAPGSGLPLSRISSASGTQLQVADPDWTCSGASCTGPGRPRIRVVLTVPSGFAAAEVPVSATASIDGRTVRTATTIAVVDPGDPYPRVTLALPGSGGPRSWPAGRILRAPLDTATSFRVWVTNAGGGPMAAGGAVTLGQTASDGVRFLSITGPGACQRTDSRWSCTWTPTTATAVGDRLGPWTVRFVATAEAEQVALGPVGATLDGSARATATPEFTADRATLPVVLSASAPQPITAGGTALLRVSVRPRSGAVDDLVLTAGLPRGIIAAIPEWPGWTCSRATGTLTCRRAGPLTDPRDLSVSLVADASAPEGLGTISWTASSASAPQSPRRIEVPLLVQPGARLSASATPRTLAAADPDSPPTPVLLQSSLAPADRVWRHTWTQACLTDADSAALCADPRVSSAAVRIRRPHSPTAVVRVPGAREDRRLVFRVTVIDGSAELTQLVTVDVAGTESGTRPLLSWQTGGRSAPVLRARPWMLAELIELTASAPRSASLSRRSAPGSAPGTGATVLRDGLEMPLLIPGARPLTVTVRGGAVRTASVGQTLTLPAVAAGGQGDLSFQWRLLSGPALPLTSTTEAAPAFTVPTGTRVSAYEVTVTDASGATASDTVVLALNPGSSPLCLLMRQAERGRILLTRGDTVLRAASASPVGSGCTGDAGVEFSRATITLGSFTVANASGVATAAGIAITEGTLRTPDQWGLAELTAVRGLSLTYGGDSLISRGAYRTGGFAFLPLPRQWFGRTRLVLGSDDSGPTTTLVSSARGRDGGSARIRGGVARDGSFTRLTVTGEAIARIGDQSIDVSGILRRPDTDGAVLGRARGRLTAEATLVSGARITDLAVTWQPGTQVPLRGAGEVAFDAGDTSLTATGRLAYRGGSAWTVRVSGGSSWTPVPGLTVDRAAGEVSLGRGGYAWNVRLTARQPWRVTPALTIRPSTLSITDACPSAMADGCPAASLLAEVSGPVTLGGLDEQLRIPGRAVITLGPQPRRAVSAVLPADVELATGLTLTDARLRAREGSPEFLPDLTETGMAVEIRGEVDVPRLGQLDNVDVAVVADGWALAASARADLGDDGGSLADPAVGYSTTPATVVVDGSAPFDIVDCATAPAAPGQACTGELVVSGDYSPPGWVTDLVGIDTVAVPAAIEIDAVSGSIEDTLDLPLLQPAALPSDGAAGLTVDTLRMRFDSSEGSLVATAEGTADLTLPSAGAPPTLRFALNHRADNDSVTGTLRPVAGERWSRAFEATGLLLDGIELAYRAGADGSSLMLSAADVTLPDDLRSTLSVPLSSSITALADLDSDTPCLVVSLASTDTDSPDVVTLADEAITAERARLVVAPDGCRVDGERIRPGYQLDVDGRTLGQDLALSAPLTRSPVAFSSRTLVPALQVGDLLLQDAAVSVDLVEGQPDAVQLEGSIDVMGSTVRAAGILTTVNGAAQAQLEATDDLMVDGFTVDQVDLKILGSRSATEVTGSATLEALGDVIPLPALDFAISHGQITRVQGGGTVAVTLPGSARVTADVGIDYSAETASLEVTAQGDVASGGLRLTDARMDLSPTCAQVRGRVDVAGLVSARLSGYLAWGSTCQIPAAGQGRVTAPSVTVASGAMCLRVAEAQFGMGGFRGTGSLTLANNADPTCSGTERAPSAASLGAEVTLLLGRQGVANSVTVSGSVAADGTYRLTGSGRVQIGGFTLTLEATASKNSEGERVQGAADLSLLGTALRFSGAFQSTPSGPSVAMAASVSPLRIGGFSLGSGQVRLYQGPGFNGMSFDANLSVGIASLASTITFRQSGSSILFYTSVAMRLGIPGVAQVAAQGTFTNCSDSQCSGVGAIRLTAKASLDLGRWRVTTPPFEITTGGRFSIRVKEGRQGLSTGRASVLGVDWWVDDASWSIDLTINESGLTGSARGRARIYSQETALKYPCGPWYWVFRDWCDYPRTNWGSFGASASFNPWAFCFSVAGSPDICLRI